ncbi:MAG TPA: D-alanyl-D-alanine dipeptidase [Rickettsiales bacterium]|nr:D-alanyl-D-alanine dipeptidase [Rickettsiales bacterium]
MSLVEICQPAFDVDIDIKYATSDNFTGVPVYKAPKCFLHVEAAAALQKAIALAKPLGLRFMIFDAYRPSEAQWKLWEHTPDPEFLADPAKGSPHSRGVAVDLGFLDGAGRLLDMGTPFDAFTPLSHHGRTDIPVEAQKNRLLLMGIMTAAGWDFYRNEWWHYQLFNSRSYALLSDADAGTGMM